MQTKVNFFHFYWWGENQYYNSLYQVWNFLTLIHCVPRSNMFHPPRVSNLQHLDCKSIALSTALPGLELGPVVFEQLVRFMRRQFYFCTLFDETCVFSSDFSSPWLPNFPLLRVFLYSQTVTHWLFNMILMVILRSIFEINGMNYCHFSKDLFWCFTVRFLADIFWINLSSDSLLLSGSDVRYMH